MASADSLTAARLRELLHYDPELGWFMRRVATGRGGCHMAGSIAGGISGDYVLIGIDGRRYRANRLAVLYMTGEWPTAEVDHREGDHTDNAWLNLRDVSPSVNKQNQRLPHRDNASGFLGVDWNKAKMRWHAGIRVDGRTRHLGYFDTPETAHAAYVEAKRRFHPGCTI